MKAKRRPKLTAWLKRKVLDRFKNGRSTIFLAAMYGLTLESVEAIIRERLIEQEKKKEGKDGINGTSNEGE